MTDSGAGGPSTRATPTAAEQDKAWRAVARLREEFRSGWDFTWTELPDGWRFVAKPFPPGLQHAEPWVIGETAEKVRAGVRLRQTPQGNTL